MSLRVKFLSLLTFIILLMVGLIVGVFAKQQIINLKGNINFDIEDTTLYVKDIRLQTDAETSETINNFMPGYIGKEFDCNLNFITTGIKHVNIYLDIVNTSEITYDAYIENTSDELQVDVSGKVDGDNVPLDNVAVSDISGTINLSISWDTNREEIDLNGILIKFIEHKQPLIYVKSVTVSNGTTTNTLSEYNGERSQLDLSSIIFKTGETTIDISMVSLNDYYIKNLVKYDELDISASSNLDVHSTSLYLPKNEQELLTTGENKHLKIYISNNTGASTTISGLNVSLEEKDSLLQADLEGQYWYIEMGTVMLETENEYVKWKYFADVNSTDENGYDVAVKAQEFNPLKKPSGVGYFVLISDSTTREYRNDGRKLHICSYNNDYIKSGNYFHQLHNWLNVKANDYATSTIRQYINGNTIYKDFTENNGIYQPSGHQSNMYKDLNIDIDNDIIYNEIISRSLGDLYSKNYHSTTGVNANGEGIEFPNLSNASLGYKYTEQDEDKFWLLSYSEAVTLLGNGTTGTDEDRAWPQENPDGLAYWAALRTPTDKPYNTYYIDTDGRITTFANDGTVAWYSIRPGFKLLV